MTGRRAVGHAGEAGFERIDGPDGTEGEEGTVEHGRARRFGIVPLLGGAAPDPAVDHDELAICGGIGAIEADSAGDVVAVNDALGGGRPLRSLDGDDLSMIESVSTRSLPARGLGRPMEELVEDALHQVLGEVLGGNPPVDRVGGDVGGECDDPAHGEDHQGLVEQPLFHLDLEHQADGGVPDPFDRILVCGDQSDVCPVAAPELLADVPGGVVEPFPGPGGVGEEVDPDVHVVIRAGIVRGNPGHAAAALDVVDLVIAVEYRGGDQIFVAAWRHDRLLGRPRNSGGAGGKHGDEILNGDGAGRDVGQRRLGLLGDRRRAGDRGGGRRRCDSSGRRRAGGHENRCERQPGA